jgi:hypothetical protein
MDNEVEISEDVTKKWIALRIGIASEMPLDEAKKITAALDALVRLAYSTGVRHGTEDKRRAGK